MGAHDDDALVGRAVDYKTLFMGACTLLVLLAGGFAGFWNRGTSQAIEDNRATNDRQWDHIFTLEQRLSEYGEQVKRLKEDGRDREERVRELERLTARMHK